MKMKADKKKMQDENNEMKDKISEMIKKLVKLLITQHKLRFSGRRNRISKIRLSIFRLRNIEEEMHSKIIENEELLELSRRLDFKTSELEVKLNNSDKLVDE
jgi:hypothetical protein